MSRLIQALPSSHCSPRSSGHFPVVENMSDLDNLLQLRLWLASPLQAAPLCTPLKVQSTPPSPLLSLPTPLPPLFQLAAAGAEGYTATCWSLEGWTGHLAYRASSRWAVDPIHGLTGSESPDSAVNHNTNQGGAGPRSIFGGESRDGLLLRQKLKMDIIKSKKRPRGAEKHREKKPKSLEVEAATCAKLTDLFGAGFTSPAAAGAPGDERGGLDNDERVEADMVDHLTCESLRSCSPSVHVRGLALCLSPLSAFTVPNISTGPNRQVENIHCLYGDIILKTQASPVFTDDDVTLCYQHQSGKHKQTSFFKNGALIDSNSSSGSDRVIKMTLKNVTREDEGFYRCASHDRQLQSPESWLSVRPDRGQLNIITLLCVL
ncbi:unnamed protein product [Pleuronectes platessa]|uniref:Ig-like domain-containing protein n=1 Tax=Pleuronectes platessa TaxID=8262 RepID=A0A9N7TKG8_PLEPL|nr:unnamed protein product [Pleuronectes platessa]